MRKVTQQVAMKYVVKSTRNLNFVETCKKAT
jgi:hypothetical protein